MDPNEPHNDLPKLPPRAKLETPRILKKLGDVKASLAALKEAGSGLPNQSVVLQSMVLQEAKLSSEIENIFTTNDELYREIEIKEDEQSPSVKEVRRYRHALWAGYEELLKKGRVDSALILSTASKVLERKVAIRSGSGTRVGNYRTGKVVYTPPVGEDLIRDLLSNLLNFVAGQSELDPLVRIGVAHYQFEAIHPFTDGNGRTGRVFNLLFMVQLGLLDLPLLYLSSEFLDSRRDYYRTLQGVTEHGRWEDWLEYFLTCVETTAIVTRRQFTLMRAAVADAKEKASTTLPRRFPESLVDLVFEKPYTRISDVVAAGFAERQTAARYLKALESIGVLRSSKQWRETLFLNQELLDILTLQPRSAR